MSIDEQPSSSCPSCVQSGALGWEELGDGSNAIDIGSGYVYDTGCVSVNTDIMGCCEEEADRLLDGFTEVMQKNYPAVATWRAFDANNNQHIFHMQAGYGPDMTAFHIRIPLDADIETVKEEARQEVANHG